jgi:hypothetical protein
MSLIKKYCKICFDSDKPESEYTSHCVKGRDGKVECPTLLKVKCRLCDQFGHTVKYCPDTQTPQPRIKKTWEKKKEKEKEKKIQPSNFYDLLDESDEEKEQKKETEKEQKKEKEKLQFQKRWVDYDSDSDDEVKPNVLQFCCLPMPILRRSSHTSPLTYDSLDESYNESYNLSDQYKFIFTTPPSQNPVLKRSHPQTFYDSSDEEQSVMV